ncbi:lipase family protein [Stakelama tenebrarum]|uniref:Lipase family protein n=1 Tax=Stakelama tenebrarum TaxID=2711215 RepID=A0A6G6Y2X6_9SPHN|nr:lipase family protein [Sphingosinithalassobacter tenebrarum]QIG78963.1 lipase family protein [Sphingosinithalassobacter tenebrarum]
MHDCIKRRLLYACTQAYDPDLETWRRGVGWVGRPESVTRDVEFWNVPIDHALVGRVAEGIVVAFRGSLPPFGRTAADGWSVLFDWLNDSFSVCRRDADYAGASVHWGFAESMRRLWHDGPDGPGIATQIEALLAQGAPRRIWFTGHSKGGALANLAAFRASQNPEWRDTTIRVLTVAAARPGDAAFARAYARTRIACLRYELAYDPVPHLPPGPQTPRWAARLLQLVAPGSVPCAEYHPVGHVVRGAGADSDWLRSWLGRTGGLLGAAARDPEGLIAAALSAHGIAPHSAYDRLICHGEPDCSHGHPPKVPPRRHESEPTRSPRRTIRATEMAPEPSARPARRHGGRR